MGLFEAVQAEYDDAMRTLAATGFVPIPELVRRVHEGDSGRWHQAAELANALVRGHEQAGDRGSSMLQSLESSWTGHGADAAGDKIRAGVKATQVSSEVYDANARQYADNAHVFDRLKSQLTPMPDQAPDRSAWDTVTPWDTDQEDKVNQYKAQLERNRQVYDSYLHSMQSSQAGVRNDFGELEPLDGGLGKIDFGGGDADETSNVGVPMTSTGTPTYGTPGGVPGTPASVPGATGTLAGNLPGTPAAQGDDSTAASSYRSPTVNPPSTSPTYQSPGYNPANLGQPGSGNNPTALGFGPNSGPHNNLAGSRFSAPGAPGGGAGGAGARAPGVGTPGAGGAAGTPGAGKATGAGPVGPGAQGAAARAPAGTSGGAAGMRGGGMMGGAGAGRGQGAEDEEHQRQYVQDSDEAFALDEDGEKLRDPITGEVVTPPVIGG